MQLSKLIPAALLLLAPSDGKADGPIPYRPAGQQAYAPAIHGGDPHVSAVPYHAADGSFVSAGPYGSTVLPPSGYAVEYPSDCDHCEVGVTGKVWDYLSNKADRIGLWLRLKDRKVKRQTYYPSFSPACEPTYGYYPTRWRRGFGDHYLAEGAVLPPEALLPAEGQPLVPAVPPAPMSEPVIEPVPQAEPVPAQPQPEPQTSLPRGISVPHFAPVSQSRPRVDVPPKSHLPVDSKVIGASTIRPVEIEARLQTTGWRPTDPKRIHALASGDK